MYGSSAAVGSSAKMTQGSVISARAIATRCRWPPDSVSGSRRNWSAIPTWPATSRTRL